MAGVNKVILVGRVGKEPDIRSLSSGDKVANFSLATSETWKDRNTGERHEQTEWHNVVLWKKLAEVVEKHVHKGDLLYIEGKLKNESWEDNGITKYITKIRGISMTMLGRGKKDENQQSTSGYNPNATQPNTDIYSGVDDDTDDLPF